MVFDIQSLFSAWQQFGLYSFVLPFLLIFAVIYGILGYMNIFKGHAGIHAVIAIVFGLLAVRFPFFTDFLEQISPRLGVGLVILLVLMILVGLFTPEGSIKTIGWIFISIAVIIGLVIFAQTSDVLGFSGGFSFGPDMVAGLVMIGLLIGVIVAVVTASSSKNTTATKVGDALKSMFGGS